MYKKVPFDHNIKFVFNKRKGKQGVTAVIIISVNGNIRCGGNDLGIKLYVFDIGCMFIYIENVTPKNRHELIF